VYIQASSILDVNRRRMLVNKAVY